MDYRISVLVIFILGNIFLSSCRETPLLKGFDSKIWKNDRNACKDLRKKQIEYIQKDKDKLKGLGQNQILSLLGKPDAHELYDRNQRFYVYFFTKGNQCEGKTDINRGNTLKLRFSAMDAVTEITINRQE